MATLLVVIEVGTLGLHATSHANPELSKLGDGRISLDITCRIIEASLPA
jgi:hypothetical protein